MLKPDDKSIDSDEVFNYRNTSSATDCTGLIPSAPAGDEELENYEELYPFLPKAVPDVKDHDRNNADKT